MRITDRDTASHLDAARIIGTGLLAALRRGYLTEQEEARIEQILERADLREQQKAEIRAAAEQAAAAAVHAAKKQKAIDKAVTRATRKYR